MDHKLFSDVHYPKCKCFTEDMAEANKAEMFSFVTQIADIEAGNMVMRNYCASAANHALAMHVFHALTVMTQYHVSLKLPEDSNPEVLRPVFKQHMHLQLEDVIARLKDFQHRNQLMMTENSSAN